MSTCLKDYEIGQEWDSDCPSFRGMYHVTSCNVEFSYLPSAEDDDSPENMAALMLRKPIQQLSEMTYKDALNFKFQLKPACTDDKASFWTNDEDGCQEKVRSAFRVLHSFIKTGKDIDLEAKEAGNILLPTLEFCVTVQGTIHRKMHLHKWSGRFIQSSVCHHQRFVPDFEKYIEISVWREGTEECHTYPHFFDRGYRDILGDALTTLIAADALNILESAQYIPSCFTNNIAIDALQHGLMVCQTVLKKL